MTLESTGLPGGELLHSLSSPNDWIWWSQRFGRNRGEKVRGGGKRGESKFRARRIAV